MTHPSTLTNNIDIDGLDQEEEQADEIDAVNAPFDPKQVEITAKKFSITTLLERVKHGELELNPDFQRRANLWDKKTKSRLIESILLGIPLPSFYFREDENGNFSVVDGLQRFCAIFHFIDYEALNKATEAHIEPLYLIDLQYLKNIQGKKFFDLDRVFQRTINELEVEVNIIRSSTPKEVMFNVFARLNQGGLPLSPQEIRNAIFPGEWRKQIRKLAESDEFRKATNNKVPTERQQDMEMVLRFIALSSQKRTSKESINSFLNETIEKILCKWTESDWKKAADIFFLSLNRAQRIFGEHAFRKSYGNQKKTAINKGIFESQLIASSVFSDEDFLVIEKNKNMILDRLSFEMKKLDSPLVKVLVAGHATSSNIRVSEFEKIIRTALDQKDEKCIVESHW